MRLCFNVRFGTMRSFSRLLLGVLAASVLMPLSAEAAGGNALIIAESTYAGVSALPDCRHAADLLSVRLRHLGFAVDEIVDAPSGDVRVAITRFAGNVAEMPGQPRFVYVCAAATTEEQRLFLLPSDVDLHGSSDPETQGIVVPALLNALRGSGGTLVAEFAMQSSAYERPSLEALRARLPAGLHLGLTMSDAPHAGSVGRVLADARTPLTAGWDALVPALRAREADAAVSLYAPVPAPPPVPITPPTPVAVSAPVPAPAPAPAPVAVATPPAPSPAPTPESVISPEAPGPVVPPPARLAQTVPAKPRPATTVAPRSNRRLLRLQSALRDQGLYRGPVNGMMNTQTVMAIRAFQISIGKPSSGTLTGPEIVQLLNSR
jgi:hypothetical protein